jgi:hypothetical protein
LRALPAELFTQPSFSAHFSNFYEFILNESQYFVAFQGLMCYPARRRKAGKAFGDHPGRREGHFILKRTQVFLCNPSPL